MYRARPCCFTLPKPNTEVQLEIAPGVHIVSVVTRASAERLGLEPGRSAFVLIKASDVMVGTD